MSKNYIIADEEAANRLLNENPIGALILILMARRCGLPFTVEDALRACNEWMAMHGEATTENVKRWLAIEAA